MNRGYFCKKAAQCGIPDYMIHSIVRYIMEGGYLGQSCFLAAVVDNDLVAAVNRADETNLKLLPEYVKFFYNYAPSTCFGSPSMRERWQKKGGVEGLRREQAS